LNTFSEPSPFSIAADGLRIRIHARPGGRHDEIEGPRAEAGGGALRVTVRAAAEDGKANAAIVKLLAGEWELRGRRSAWSPAPRIAANRFIWQGSRKRFSPGSKDG
jgi:hypothetical protein